MLDFVDISEIVQSLDNDFNDLRQDAKRRYDLYRMRKEPYVADEIAREGKFRMLSPMVMYAAETIRADLMMNPTEFTVIPLARETDGRVLKEQSKSAEALERSLAVLWGRLNEGRRLDREVIWHQLVSPFACLILEFNPYTPPPQPEDMDDKVYTKLIQTYEDQWLPWHVFMPDPMTCSWIERDGKPIMFARKYRILVRELEDIYNKNLASSEPDKKLLFENNHFKWVSDDYDTTTSYQKEAFREVEVLWLDDGQHIYQAVLNPGSTEGAGIPTNKTGLVVSCVPNPTGRCTGFVVPGNLTPDRRPENRYEPFLLPLMQVANQINDLRSTRATAARNLAGPHTYVTIDPEIAKLYMQRGEKLPTEVRWKKNVTHYLLGTVEVMPSELSQDWDKIETQIQMELERYLPSQFVNVIDPAVLKSATATSILHAAEASVRIYGPLMSAYDAVIRDIMESVLISVESYYSDQTIHLFSTGEEMVKGKNLKAGAYNKLNSKMLEDFDFKLMVKTRGMSRSQASAQYEAVLAQWILPDGTKGPATMDDLIDAANYTDREEQKKKLAVEGILSANDPWLMQMAQSYIREKMYIDSGIDLPIGVPMGGAGAEQPSGMPNAAQRMDAPQVSGPQGGSSPEAA